MQFSNVYFPLGAGPAAAVIASAIGGVLVLLIGYKVGFRLVGWMVRRVLGLGTDYSGDAGTNETRNGGNHSFFGRNKLMPDKPGRYQSRAQAFITSRR